jgi:hypothetical protein
MDIIATSSIAGEGREVSTERLSMSLPSSSVLSLIEGFLGRDDVAVVRQVCRAWGENSYQIQVDRHL